MVPWLLFGLSRVLGVGGPPDRLGLGVVALAGTALLLAGHLPTAVQLLVPLWRERRCLPSSPGARRRLTPVRDGPNRVTVDVNQPRAGILVFRELADPGWQVRVDGLPGTAVTADGMFLGVALRPGPHRVEFAYRPPEWRLGLALCGAGAACLLAFTLLAARHRQPAGTRRGCCIIPAWGPP